MLNMARQPPQSPSADSPALMTERPGFWQRLMGKRAVRPPSPQSDAPEVSFADLFGGPAQALPSKILPLPDPVEGTLPPSQALETDQAIMTAWAVRELARWHAAPMDEAQVHASFERLNAKDSEIFVYNFESGTVEMAEKPPALAIHPATLRRSQSYLAFFRDVARRLPVDFRTTIAMGLGDKVEFVPDVPIMCFQKRRGNATILVPDIDFIQWNFYESADFIDVVAFEKKANRAVFIGGTSGGTITPDVARNCTLPRLRAARYFVGHDRVDFLLPQIVQTTTEEARAILEQMPFCRSERRGWKYQLAYRFLISVDGNGATCSRVAISLHSNSVLLKYDSDELLYYFQGLQPWLHYIPISREQDVEHAFELDAWSPGMLARVARDSRAFAQRFLTREAVTAYMAQVLLLYPACFAGTRTEIDVPDSVVQAAYVSIIAHIEEKGDTEADESGWVGLNTQPRSIEGFSISCIAGNWRQHISYQAILTGQGAGPLTPCDSYCGTRGKQQPIQGFILHLANGAPHGVLTYEGVFADGFRSTPLTPGTPCVSPNQARLVAMRVSIVEQSSAP